MRYHFFVHHEWFLQNLGKEAVRTNMHTTVVTGLSIFGSNTTHSYQELLRYMKFQLIGARKYYEFGCFSNRKSGRFDQNSTVIYFCRQKKLIFMIIRIAIRKAADFFYTTRTLGASDNKRRIRRSTERQDHIRFGSQDY